MNRRTFLLITAGSPLVFGLRELLAQESAPDFVAPALKRMKETRRFGVFLVIPETEAARQALGSGLLARMPNGSKSGTHGYELFCAHVFVCVNHEQAAKLGLGAKRGPSGVLRCLVNPEGKQIVADRVPLDAFEDSGKFADSFTSFVLGPEGLRLKEHAKSIESGLSDEVKKAAELLSGRAADTQNAISTLTAAADTLAPWILQKSIEKPGTGFETVLWNFYLRQSLQDPEPALPFGLKVERGVVADPCPPCGMAAYRAASYRFISFYAK